jgi:hypothetical protein
MLQSKTILSLTAVCAVLASIPAALAVDPLYQWKFTNGSGANTGTSSGGTLVTNVAWTGTTGTPTAPTSGSLVSGGISGTVGDDSLWTYNGQDNWYGSNTGNAEAVSNLNLTGLTQFTITMWVKRNGGNNCSILNIGSTTAPDGTSNPGISLGLTGNWANGVSIGVNGNTGWSGNNAWGGYTSGWVFLAFACNTTEWNWWAPSMAALYGGAENNAALLVGSGSTSVTVASNIAIGGPGNSPGAPAFGSTATAIFGNNANGTVGFSGNMDDIRIYNSLLTVSQIDAVRLEALAVPEPTTVVFVMGGVGMLALIRRRKNRMA